MLEPVAACSDGAQSVSPTLKSIFDAVPPLGFWLEVASLFAEPLNVGFGLFAR